MLLKKQTVWLLTMLSLVLVLSVYYVTLDEDPLQVADSQSEESEGEEDVTTSGADKDDDMNSKEEAPTSEDINKEDEQSDEDVIQSISDDELFTSLRLQLLDERSRQSEELTKVVGTTNLSVSDRNAALEEINNLQKVAEQEYLLETLIKALDYEDALVHAAEGEVKITVKADELSAGEANEILQIVMEELGEDNLYTVQYQPLN